MSVPTPFPLAIEWAANDHISVSFECSGFTLDSLKHFVFVISKFVMTDISNQLRWHDDFNNLFINSFGISVEMIHNTVIVSFPISA